MENLDLSIVLPAHNESKNLPSVLRELKKALGEGGIKFEIIVVDNGSTDDTREVLEQLKSEISELKTLRIEEIGAGVAVIKGLAIAQGRTFGFMDADGQVRPEDVAKVYFKLKNENLDLCKGTRVKRFFSLKREIVSRIYNFIFRIMFRLPLRDINGNPKVFTRNFYKEIELVSKDWFFEAEIMLKAKKGRYRVGEAPIVYLERAGGESHVSMATIFEFIKNMFYWRFLLWKK